MLLDFLKKTSCPIGVDIDGTGIKMAQLAYENNGIHMVKANFAQLSDEVEFGSSEWQRWAISSIKRMLEEGGFSTRHIVTSMPSRDVFVEQCSIPNTKKNEMEQAIFSKIKQGLPFKPEAATVQHVVIGDSKSNPKNVDVLVMATEKEKVERHLAIYERANLEIKGITLWPLAMVKAYTKFFGRRQADRDITVLLLNIDMNYSNIVICQHDDLLFARTMPVGYVHITNDNMSERFISEIEACVRYFESSNANKTIKRLMLLASDAPESAVCKKISAFAQSRSVPAQIGDVLKACNIGNTLDNPVLDRRNCNVDWTNAFGLSLC